MPFYLVTMKNPGRAAKFHEKELGPCNMSPVCTDSEGAHHTFLGKADNIDAIFAAALKDGMHITRVEEVYHVRDYGVTDVSVRDDSDRPIGYARASQLLTEFRLEHAPGFESIPHVADGERIYYSSDPHGEYVMGIETGLSYVSSGSAGEVSGADGEDNSSEPEEKTDYRIGPDTEGVIRNH